MTTTQQFGGYAPPPPPPGQRVLRRSRTDRVGAGVAGGLGHYFDVDPVLFRVLFATAAFFGGAGVLAYLLAWVAIPEEGTAHAPIDRVVGELRRRKVPLWLVAGIGGLALWGIAFSWWMPWHSFPVILLVVVLVAIFAGRGRRRYRQNEPTPSGAAGTDTNTATDTAWIPPETPPTADLGPSTGAAPDRPTWVDEGRQWINEAKIARRERRRRAAPVRIATLSALVLVLGILAAIDAGSGIAIPVYLWVTLGIVLLGVLSGAVLRRAPWSVAPLLVPAIVGLVAFGSTSASLHDGVGQRDWTPTSESAIGSSYRMAFGQGVLDLRSVGTLTEAHTIDIRMASGQVRVLLPPTMNATVLADVRWGEVQVTGLPDSHPSDYDSHGFGISRTVLAPQGASGPAVTIRVHLADGNVNIDSEG